jgi:DNA-binding response OmpR family regulator
MTLTGEAEGVIANQRSVLLVEDDAALRHAMTLLLQRHGHQVTSAASIAEAVARLDGQSVVLLDLTLPDGTGDAVLTELRRRQSSARVAVLTAGATAPTLARVYAGRPDRLFMKPVDVDELLRWVAA